MNPPAVGSTANPRSSPPTSRRTRIATSQEPPPPARQRPPRGRRPLEREGRPARRPAAHDEGCRDRSEALLPRATAPEASRDAQVRDHRGPQIPPDELGRPKERAMERQGRAHPTDL